MIFLSFLLIAFLLYCRSHFTEIVVTLKLRLKQFKGDSEAPRKVCKIKWCSVQRTKYG